jgi:hypothetical protein
VGRAFSLRLASAGLFEGLTNFPGSAALGLTETKANEIPSSAIACLFRGRLKPAEACLKPLHSECLPTGLSTACHEFQRPGARAALALIGQAEACPTKKTGVRAFYSAARTLSVIATTGELAPNHAENRTDAR